MRQFRWAVGPQGRAQAVELRLDYLGGPSERGKLFRWLCGQRRLPVVIATCRTRPSGGRFAGNAQAELAVLAQAVRAGCLWCDVDVRTASHVKPADLRRALAPARVLVSAHDFRRVPGRLEAWVTQLERCGGHAIKRSPQPAGISPRLAAFWRSLIGGETLWSSPWASRCLRLAFWHFERVAR